MGTHMPDFISESKTLTHSVGIIPVFGGEKGEKGEKVIKLKDKSSLQGRPG